MAINYDRWVNWGRLYCGGSIDDREHWMGTMYDPPTWTRYSADSGKISVDMWARYGRSGIGWISPGQKTQISIELNGTIFAQAMGPNTYNACYEAESHIMSVSGNGYVIQTPSNPYSQLIMDIGSNWGNSLNHYFTCWSDLGEHAAVYNLGDNFKISAPSGLTATLGNYSLAQLHCDASISSWSKNVNIKGTPYTGSGGRTWNFMAEIKNPAGTSLYRIEKNTGETKSCSWDFTGMNLPVNTTLTLRIVVSNNYQQIREWTTTFNIKPIGKVITTGSEKWIFAGDKIASIEEGEGIKKIIKFGKVVG